MATDKIITYNFTEDFILNVSDYIEKHMLKNGNDLSRTGIVFGGKRPFLFLKRELSQRIKRSFFPPAVFSIDNFANYILSKDKNFRLATDLEASFIIYSEAERISSGILHGKENFSDFLPTAKEITGFIDELDIEDISADDLAKRLAETVYKIPESINKNLGCIIKLRELYHAGLYNRDLRSRGLLYRDASKYISKADLSEFDKIIFCNFYYMHKTEKDMLKYLYETDKAILFFQKDANAWPVFEDISKLFGHKIEPRGKPEEPSYSIKIYKGFDSHSEAGIVREILNNEIKQKAGALEKTVVILPDTNNLIPLISEISSQVESFNVSMGYPLKRSALYGLLKFIFEAQSTARGKNYYTRDYLKVLLHPLMKNMKIVTDPASTRILIHKIEETLLGMKESPLSGTLFVSLDDIENLDEIYQYASISMAHMDINISPSELKNMLKEIHSLAFRIWESISNFSQFSACIEKLNESLISKSFISYFPLNVNIMERTYDIIDELKNAEFKDQPFNREDIFRIFDSKLRDEMISFKGSPLKGLQILGLFETRSLNFENVIVMDANESILPKIRVPGHIIPGQVMEGLGLNRLKQEEEIQRYHFMRLISGAKNVYFVYSENPEKEKSRFLEEIIWKKQKAENALNIYSEARAKFNAAGIGPGKNAVKKDKKTVEKFKEDFVYSSSSIDTYLNCPVKFYYQYVLRLKEKEDLLNEPEAKEIGTFIHELLDSAFKRFLNKKPLIDKTFEKDFFDEFEKRFSKELGKRLGPESFLVKEVMRHRLGKFLGNERLRNVEKILSLEEDRPVEKIKLPGKQVNFKYRIDRIDQIENGNILVVDYKTGTSAKAPNIKKIDAIEFNRKSIKEIIYSFQLPVYYYFVKKRYAGPVINAALYSLQDLNFTDFIKIDDMDKISHVMDVCLKALEFIIDEILNPEMDFETDDSNERNCEYCEFSGMC